MTSKEIETSMRRFTDGSDFITATELTRYLGQKNAQRIKTRYLLGLPTLQGTRSYFLPDVAKRLYNSAEYAD